MGFRRFLSDLNIIISENFLFSQSRFTSLVVDKFKSSNLNTKFNHISGKLVLNNQKFDKKNIIFSNKYRSKNLAEHYNTKEICSEIRQIIENHRKEIEGYLGREFLYEETLYFRNYHYPKEMEGYDIYSNVWHLDSHDGNRLLKIFINLMDVKKTDGPFCYLTETVTRSVWNKMGRRWTFSNMGNIFDPLETKYSIGGKGSYLIIDTSRCLHRASNPIKYRDMMQITLYPRWRASDKRFKYIFDQ